MEKENKLAKDQWISVSTLLNDINIRVDKDEVRVRAQCKPTILKTALQLDAMFWSFDEVKSYTYPSDWWSHFKLCFFPKWLLRLFPACKTKVTIKEVVPQLPEEFKSCLKDQKENIFIPQYDFKEEYKTYLTKK